VDRGQPEAKNREILPGDTALYVEALDSMRREVEVIMRGSSHPTYVVAPKPELVMLTTFNRMTLEASLGSN